LLFKLIKGLLIFSIKIKGLVLFNKVDKRLSNSAIVFNKALVEITEA
jgi:hypothetical protein